MRWHVTDSLTGAILGQVRSHNWDITEPLREPSTATVRAALPSDSGQRQQLRDLIRPKGLRSFDRTLCLEDNGNILFSGPITSRPSKDGGEVVIPLVDWRSWFYTAPIRPQGSTFTVRDNPTWLSWDQGIIMADLASLALTNKMLDVGAARLPGAPPIHIDSPPTTGTTRKLSTKMFQGNSVGEWLDGLMKQSKGAEWYTYSKLSSSEMKILPHFAIGWPERSSLSEPIRLTYRQGKIGNASGYSWPQNVTAPTRVWAMDGGEVTKIWSQSTSPTVAAGTDLLWETMVTLDDTKAKKKDAQARAKGELKTFTGKEAELSVTVIAEKLPFGSYVVGDRVRLFIEDDWESVNTKASRITQRVLSYAAGEPTQSVLTIDTTDDQYPDDGTDPGVKVTSG
jgi:hypothetical protein